MKFLNNLAKKITKEYSNQNISLVFPTKRAGFFFLKILQNHKNNNKISIYSMNSFIKSFKKEEILSENELIMILLEIVNKNFKDYKNEYELFSIIKIMLKDFEEIDKELIDTKDFFSYIKELENIDEKYEENRQKNNSIRIKFLYNELEKKLKLIGKTYLGKIYKELVNGYIKNPHKNIIFAGFNYLSKSEVKIIKNLLNKNLAKIYFNYDNYYLNNYIQEAGDIARKNIKTFNIKNEIYDNFIENKKDIIITELGSPISEIKNLKNILKDIKNEDDYAIILNDINYLIPLLDNIPKNIKNINVSLGYPFKNSLFYNLISSIIKIQEKLQLNNSFHKDDIKSFIFNFYMLNILKQKIDLDELIKNINRCTKLISLEELSILLGRDITIKLFFTWKSKDDFFNSFEFLIEELENIKSIIPYIPEIDIVSFFIENFSTIKNYTENKEFINLKMLSRIFIDFFENEYIPLGEENETTKGIQILSLSSSQALDFKNTIFLSFNENNVNNNTKISFIPYDVRKRFSMPTYQDLDCEVAYQFYSLLQNGNEILISYNSDISKKNEKSRFIEQIKYELRDYKNISISNTLFNFKQCNKNIEKLKIKKHKETIDKLLSFNISPTALNQYRKCSLSYYFKYALGMREEMIDALDARNIGTVTHNTLEDLFNKRVINYKNFDNILEDLEKSLSKNFKNIIGDYNSGENFLTFNVIKKAIKNFLSMEKEYLPIKIVALEKEYSRVFKYKNRDIKLKGTIDRIDEIKIGNEKRFRIIDYKTGIPHLNNISCFSKDIHELKRLKEIPFQLLFYYYIFNKNIEPDLNIFSIMSNKKIYHKLNISKSIVDKLIIEFEELLNNIFDELTNMDIPFTQTDDENRCKYCEYKNICTL